MKVISKDLRDKVILITGGSAGLGEQIAYQCAKQKATVIVCARRIQLIGKVRQTCEELSGKTAYAHQLDMSNPANVEEVFEKIKSEIGTIDVLINCAGFGFFENFTSFDMEVAEKMFRVNVLGLMYLTQMTALLMAEKGTGHIINIASQAGKIATPKAAVYSATKFAVLGFSNALRLEMKPLGISVTTVNPGPIATEFFDIADQSGEYLKSIDWLVLQPDVLARKIVQLIGRNRRELNSPLLFEWVSKAYQLFPHIGDYVAGNLLNKK